MFGKLGLRYLMVTVERTGRLVEVIMKECLVAYLDNLKQNPRAYHELTTYAHIMSVFSAFNSGCTSSSPIPPSRAQSSAYCFSARQTNGLLLEKSKSMSSKSRFAVSM